jgi:hypothetical protein
MQLKKAKEVKEARKPHSASHAEAVFPNSARTGGPDVNQNRLAWSFCFVFVPPKKWVLDIH